MSDRFPTLADVCHAIAEGHIPTAIDGNMYQVNALELRRYFDKRQALPPMAQSPSSLSSPDEYSTSSRISVA